MRGGEGGQNWNNSRESEAAKQSPLQEAPRVSHQTSVLLGAIWPYNDLDNIIADSRKQTVLRLFLDATLKTVACLHASTGSQDLANQKLAILDRTSPRRVWLRQGPRADCAATPKGPLNRERPNEPFERPSFLPRTARRGTTSPWPIK